VNFDVRFADVEIECVVHGCFPVGLAPEAN
jgi:hypothetical protein